MLIVKNPFTHQEIQRLSFASATEIQECLSLSQKAYERWRNSTAFDRAQVLLEVAQALEDQKSRFAEIICAEAGKPIRLAQAEVTRCLGVLRWAAAEAQRFSGELLRLDTTASGNAGLGIHTRFPRGPILGITPFNFPLNLVAHKVAPAIAVGSSILIKPSLLAPLTAIAFAELFKKTRAPVGLVQTIIASDSDTAALTQAQEISMISFTGSSAIGHKIRSQACSKPITLELGGNAWAFVLDDVDPSLFPKIAQKITLGAFGYAGQSCISVQNFAAPHGMLAALREQLNRATLQTPTGDPFQPETLTGPVINEAAFTRITQAIQGAPQGSQVIHAEKHPASWVISPTVIHLPESTDFGHSNALVQQEIFGPVLTTSGFGNLDEIIRRINSSPYGLQAGVFTNHWPSIEKLYRELNVGGVVINDAPTTRYDHQPYGGLKDSGQGREGIRYAMEEMTDSKFLALSSGG